MQSVPTRLGPLPRPAPPLPPPRRQRGGRLRTGAQRPLIPRSRRQTGNGRGRRSPGCPPAPALGVGGTRPRGLAAPGQPLRRGSQPACSAPLPLGALRGGSPSPPPPSGGGAEPLLSLWGGGGKLQATPPGAGPAAALWGCRWNGAPRALRSFGGLRRASPASPAPGAVPAFPPSLPRRQALKLRAGARSVCVCLTVPEA